jgi:hypothetical protein
MATPTPGLSPLVVDASARPSAVPSPSRESTEHADIELLFRRVTELKTRADEADKPWYRVPSTILPILVSIFALAVSVYIPIREERQHASEELSTKLENVTTLVGQIIDLRKENSERMASSSNPELFQIESQLLNAKKLGLQERVTKLLDDPQASSKVDPSVVQALASEVGLSGDEGVARNLLQTVLRRKDIDGWQRASTSVALGFWEMQPDSTKFPDIVNDGRHNMEQAVQFYQDQPGERSKEALVYTHVAWAKQELLVNNRQGAKNELQIALACIGRLHPFNVDKPYLQSSYLAVERLVDGSQGGLSAALTDADTGRWYGSWAVNISPPAGTSGPLILIPNKQTNLVDARLDLFKDNVLVEKFVGSGSFLNAGAMRIDWLGVVRPANVPGYPPSQTYGYTLLHLDTANRLNMKTYLLGEATAQGRGMKNK